MVVTLDLRSTVVTMSNTCYPNLHYHITPTPTPRALNSPLHLQRGDRNFQHSNILICLVSLHGGELFNCCLDYALGSNMNTCTDCFEKEASGKFYSNV